MREVWIADTAPIIVLAKIDHIDLLTGLAPNILIPIQVIREINYGPVSDPARRAIANGWGERRSVRYVSVSVRSIAGLGPGEQAVLALALKHPGCRAVLDDAAARAGARMLGIQTIGTLGVLVRAKREGLIPFIAPVVRELRNVGLYLDGGLIEQVLSGVGENWP